MDGNIIIEEYREETSGLISSRNKICSRPPFPAFRGLRLLSALDFAGSGGQTGGDTPISAASAPKRLNSTRYEVIACLPFRRSPLEDFMKFTGIGWRG